MALAATGCVAARSSGPVAQTSATGATAGEAGALSVQQAIAADRSRLKGLAVDVAAYIDLAPSASDSSGLAGQQAGCPVVVDRLPALTDHPFARTFSVAGVQLPNSIPAAVPALRLVIPYELGIIDLPPRARLRGHFFDPKYARCPDAGGLFVLESVVQSLPAAEQPSPTEQPVTAGWSRWQDQRLGLGIQHPTGWKVDESRNKGSIVQVMFRDPRENRSVTLAVLAGLTLWSPGAAAAPPEPLQGDRQLPTTVGNVRARLVDVLGDASPNGRARQIRFVLNYQGNTVIISTRFTDGAALDQRLLGIFTAMVQSAWFDRPAEASDPLDPTLTAKATVGPGPFLSKGAAQQRAIAASGLREATALDARLVSEKEARQTVSDACRDFPERPDAVWLVTVQGTLPTGQDGRRLVYLDAASGEGVCQTDAPPPAP